MKRGEHEAPRRLWEFKKKLALWAIVAASASALISFVLAAFDKQPVSELSTAIFTSCVAYLVSYAATSLGEKHSRNKYHLDRDGNPITTDTNSTNGGACG